MKKYPRPKLFDPSEEEIAAAAKRLAIQSMDSLSKKQFKHENTSIPPRAGVHAQRNS